MKRYTVKDFDRDFPDDAACLEWLKTFLYPKGVSCPICKKVTKHHRIASRLSYSCDICGHHIHPMAGTIYEKSTTPLRLWFYATFLMASTRCGISAKQLQRELGVTYKTAWRIFKQIRSMLDEDVTSLLGEVEADETYIGGKAKNRHASRRDSTRGRGAAGKTPVFGMAQRKGKVIATVVADVSRKTILPKVQAKVLSRSLVYTDELSTYDPLLDMGYQHKRVHHAAKVYVQGDAHTNTIEGFWSLVKRGISGVNHAVSAKYLQGYVNSYSFRWNHRDDEEPMFLTVLRQVHRSG